MGHANWYAGNVAMVDNLLLGTIDWKLVADTEAVMAGLAASCYAASATLSAVAWVLMWAISFFSSLASWPISLRRRRSVRTPAKFQLAQFREQQQANDEQVEHQPQVG